MSVEWIEVAWMIISVVGAVIHGLGLRAAWEDCRLLRAYRANGARLIVARGHLYHHGARLVVKLAFALVGIVALRLPPLPPSHPPAVAGVIVVALMTANVALLWASVMDALHRRALLRWYRTRQQKEGEQ